MHAFTKDLYFYYVHFGVLQWYSLSSRCGQFRSDQKTPLMPNKEVIFPGSPGTMNKLGKISVQNKIRRIINANRRFGSNTAVSSVL